tara:strand:+ start:5354 stop:6874 length:1521 start_codon:yes stop_codon:yes gene_type:complete
MQAVAGIGAFLFLASLTSYRNIKADLRCGPEEEYINGNCLCDDGYTRDVKGKCVKRKTRNPFTSSAFTNKSYTPKSEIEFVPSYTVPGVYPSYSSYKNVPYSNYNEINKHQANLQLLNQTKPYMYENKIGVVKDFDRMANVQHSSIGGGSGIHDNPFDVKSMKHSLEYLKTNAHELDENPGPYPSINFKHKQYEPKSVVGGSDLYVFDSLGDRTVKNYDPQPMNLNSTGIAIADRAADYAVSSMGLNYANVHQQLTNYANGETMTSYKPLNATVRPISNPVLTNRHPEKENTYSPIENDNVLAPPIPIDDVKVKKKNGELHSRQPYANTGSYIADKPRGKLPEIDVGDALHIWNAANPFYDVTGKYNSREHTEFRNKRPLIVPKMLGNPNNEFLDPLEDMARKDKLNYEIDNVYNEKLIAEPRAAQANIDVNLIRSTDVRNTSNKSQSTNVSEFPLYDNSFHNTPPTRGVRITSNKSQDILSPYSLPILNLEDYSSRDMAMGLPTL